MSWNSYGSQVPSKQPQRGILRYSHKKERRYQHRRYPEKLIEKDEEELLVFGYSCKIFPPDDRSRDIAKGRHLIPWNGDYNLQLMIDRYDARASLHDLSDFDGDSWNTEYEMSEEEARIEQVCDQERYMAMYTDIAEERLRHEEELKRLHASIAGEESSFKEVAFDYDSAQLEAPELNSQSQTEAVVDEVEKVDEVEEKPFLAPATLAIPQDMEIPPTEKMHAIIEKTANFVSKSGPQMEIVLKAKQASSSQFLFLDFDHYLNPYYKHILQRIKDGKYMPGMNEEKTEEEEDEENDSDSDEDGGYLHPSLFASSRKPKEEEEEEKREKFKAIRKVDPNHPLAKLIEKGRKANALKQYNIMKSAVQSYNPGKENALEPPPLPKFMENEKNSSASSSPLTQQDQDALPPRITPQEAAMVIVPPPPDIQPMVDSVAKQIAEEGDAAEQTMRSKNDPLLAFLQTSHELHPYYTFRKTYIREQLKAQKRLQQQQEGQGTDDANDVKQDSAPISFSIKGKKEGTAKSSLLSKQLALSDNAETDDESDPDAKKQVKEKNKNEGNFTNAEGKGKSKSKRKFSEGPEDPSKLSDTATALTMTEEDRKRLLEQTRKKFSAMPPNPSSISNFTVVTPDGNTMSIAEFREKQAERRQKAALLAQQKAKESAAAVTLEPTQPKTSASQDIFDIFEDNDSKVAQTEGRNSATGESAVTRSSPQRKQSSIEQKSSPAVPAASTALTLKDLVVAASRSNTPSTDVTKEARRRRSGSRSPRRSRSRSKHGSRSRSRSRHLSPYSHKRRRNGRSRSREREYMPSSYKKMLGSSSHRSTGSRRRRYDDDENVPSAYRIENPPSAYGNGTYSRSRRWNTSPERRKRRHDSDKEDRKKHRDHGSPSRKSKKKHSKSKKKHKKKKSKSKKRKGKDSSSEEGEWSSDEDGSHSDETKVVKMKDESDNTKDTITEKEEGELTPQDNKNSSKG